MRGNYFSASGAISGIRFGGFVLVTIHIGSERISGFKGIIILITYFHDITRIYGIPFSTLLQDLSFPGLLHAVSWGGAFVPTTPFRGQVQFSIAGRR